MIYPTAPAYSLKSRSKPRQAPPPPAPDAYTPHRTTTLSKSPTWKLGMQLRKHPSTNQIPSPNTYTPHPAEKSRKFGVIGHEKRLKQTHSSTPGPGAYEPPHNKQNIGTSFPQQPKCIIKINAYPGPGAYDACLRKERGIKMTRQARFTTEGQGELSPGPADYECPRSNSGSHSFGRAQRISSPKITSNPVGPGQYGFTTLFDENAHEKKGFTMAARRNTKDQRCSPGPANYSPTYRDLPRSPSITMSRKYRERPSHRSPSPNQYDPQSCLFTATKAGSFSIGKAEKLPLKVDEYMPGPGAYLKTEYISTGVSISLGKNMPGPGAYNPRSSVIQQRPKSAKIGLSKRFQKLNTENSPSPGYYQCSTGTFDNPRYSFPKKKRLSLKRDALPGPGAYNIPGTLCRATVK